MDFRQPFVDTTVRRAGLYGLVDNVYPSELRRRDLALVRRWGAIPGSFGWMDNAYNPAARYTQQDNSSVSDSSQDMPQGPGAPFASALLDYINSSNASFPERLRYALAIRQNMPQGPGAPFASALLDYINSSNAGFPERLRRANALRQNMQQRFGAPFASALLDYINSSNAGFPERLHRANALRRYVGLLPPSWEWS